MIFRKPDSMRTFLITLLAGFIPCSFGLGACHFCGIIRIHISAVRDPVVLASGSGDPDHITHWLRICSSRIRRSIAGRTGILISGGRLCAGIRFISSRIIITGTLVPLDIASVADCDHRTLLISTKYLYSHIPRVMSQVTAGWISSTCTYLPPSSSNILPQAMSTWLT